MVRVAELSHRRTAGETDAPQLAIDGGASQNDWLAQFQADVSVVSDTAPFSAVACWPARPMTDFEQTVRTLARKYALENLGSLVVKAVSQ
mgnify:CR=1 FL=1